MDSYTVSWMCFSHLSFSKLETGSARPGILQKKNWTRWSISNCMQLERHAVLHIVLVVVCTSCMSACGWLVWIQTGFHSQQDFLYIFINAVYLISSHPPLYNSRLRKTNTSASCCGAGVHLKLSEPLSWFILLLLLLCAVELSKELGLYKHCQSVQQLSNHPSVVIVSVCFTTFFGVFFYTFQTHTGLYSFILL